MGRKEKCLFEEADKLMPDFKGTNVCIQFSGGSDSSIQNVTAIRSCSSVDLFKHAGHMAIENSCKSFKLLNDKKPNTFEHTFIAINSMFLELYNRKYIKNLIKYRTLQMQFTCFVCQACFHINTIIYCLKIIFMMLETELILNMKRYHPCRSKS